MDIDDAIPLDRLRRNGPRVIVKRRRHAVVPAQPDAMPGHTEAGEKKPRVFQVRAPAEASPAASAEAESLNVPAAVDMAEAPEPPRPLRRARRDPTHAPGAVTRIVYAPPPPAEPVGPDGQPWDFGGPEAEQYRAVRQALERVQHELDMARSARRFKLR